MNGRFCFEKLICISMLCDKCIYPGLMKDIVFIEKFRSGVV